MMEKEWPMDEAKSEVATKKKNRMAIGASYSPLFFMGSPSKSLCVCTPWSGIVAMAAMATQD
jgi:hypothetical protein